MRLVKARNGAVNLHIWRDGEEYVRQKGPIFLNQWNNVIFSGFPGRPMPNTRYIDLSKVPLDFPDDTFDAAYLNHVCEHLTLVEGARCLRQIFNLLKPGAICRLSVPDLETACRIYLAELEAAVDNPTPQKLLRYRWSVMKIFEQMVRETSGGMMLEAISRGDYDADQVREIFGDALNPILQARQPGEVRRTRPDRPSLPRRMYRSLRRTIARAPSGPMHPRRTKEAVVWMFDRLSLRLLLEEAGFEDVEHTDHRFSRIPGWAAYDFDRSVHGDYPLDESVFVEGRKPHKPRRPAR